MTKRQHPNIGELVKGTRKAKGLTLEATSEMSGVSKSMLSSIERGQVNPTFSVVWAMTQALGIDLAELEGSAERSSPIEHLHSYSTPVRSSADRLCTLYMLNPRRTVMPVEWHRLVMAPEGCLDSEGHVSGTYEHLTCLRGALSVTVDERTVHAEAGDTLRYQADRRHTINNVSGDETEALLLVAQPSQYRVSDPSA